MIFKTREKQKDIRKLLRIPIASILSTLKITLKSQNPLFLLTFSPWHLLRKHNTKKNTDHLRDFSREEIRDKREKKR